MNIVIIYFGIVRNGSVAIESIQRNIIQENTSIGAKITTIAALNILDIVENQRSGERGIRVDPAGCFMLHADHYVLSRQDDNAVRRELYVAMRSKDPHSDDYRSVRNNLHQLNTLRRGWDSLKALSNVSYDYYLFIRPDLIYIDPIRLDVFCRRLRSENSILIPPWHSWGGLNDRFALAAPAAARQYARRLDYISSAEFRFEMHGETLNAWSLARARCEVGSLSVRARRMRANGFIVDEDFDASSISLPEVPSEFFYNIGGHGSAS